MSNILLDTLKNQPLICAEGYLFEMERRGYLTSGEFVPEVALEHPEVLENLHKEFQHAGSNIVQAFTYNGHREKMRVIDKEHLLEPLNRAALKIARKCADNPPQGLGVSLMAGNISNSNIWEANNPKIQAQVKSMFAEMVQWAKEEKADFIIGETFYYAEEAFAALKEIKKSGLPSVITISPMGENKMRDGYTILETCKKLEELRADVVGLNCFRGPATMLPYIKEIRKELKCHVAALPVPYRTTKQHPTFFNLPDNNGCNCPSPHGRTFPTAMDPLQCNRYEIGNFAKEVFDLGVKYIGVCCGASPMHIREVAEAIGLRVPASRFRENMSKHFMYGTDKKIPKHMKEYGNIA